MRKSLGLGFAFSLFLYSSIVSSSYAQYVPTEALDRDYEACMGGKTQETDPERHVFCDCVRQGTQNWSGDEYVATAQQAMNANDQQQMPDNLQKIASSCLAKALH